MIGGEVCLTLKNITLYEDTIAFEDVDGGVFYVCLRRESDMVEKVRESLFRYEFKSVSEDMDLRIMKKIDELLKTRIKKNCEIPF